MNRETAIIIFIKYPESGNVKTRLAKTIGHTRAVKLYTCFVTDTVSKLARFDLPVIIAYWPADKYEHIQHWLGNEYEFICQKGTDLGCRMANAFLDIFNCGFSQCLLLGTDSPDLPKAHIQYAIDTLKQQRTPVLGPSLDGGYYLIGFTKETFTPDIFQGIAWGTEKVLAETTKLLEKFQQDYTLIPEWHDFDTFEDLKQFRLSKENEVLCPNTYHYLKNLIHD